MLTLVIDRFDPRLEGAAQLVQTRWRMSSSSTSTCCLIVRNTRSIFPHPSGRPEIGVDMSVFATDQSAGKRRSGKRRNGSKWLDWTLEETAMAAIRTKDSYLAAQYARLKPPPRPQEGAWRSQALDHLHHLGHALHRRAPQRPRRRLLPQTRPERMTKRLIAQLESDGHKVTLEDLPHAA